MTSALATVDRPISHRRLQHILGTLLLGTTVCGSLLAVRCIRTHRIHFDWLLGNLLLAWIPLVLSFALRRLMAQPERTGWKILTGTLWFLFFPNAFYIVTDLIHYDRFGMDGMPKWFDILMTETFAFGGVFLGSLSLYLLHLMVRARYGWPAGWGFASGMLGLGALGVYLGRVQRLNSWDMITRPAKFLHSVGILFRPDRIGGIISYTAAFFAFSLAIYAFITSCIRLHEQEE
jgi:uncharacterized membrane protein